ncbi:unnamed protein product [Cylicocyclus nassatus]|uniref:Uncharacterized protein n=1 Tax=Cylicocyclus nassatus TaxID=53992 RepID=A0AA36DVR2_CYLNA|nr:unnamed protein product [Cylicocyclus nassatus]
MLSFNQAYAGLLFLGLLFQGTIGEKRCPCPTNLYDTKLCPSKENCYKDPNAIKYGPPDCKPTIQCPGDYFMKFIFDDNMEMENLPVKRDWKFIKCLNGEWTMEWAKGKNQYPIVHMACYPKRI